MVECDTQEEIDYYWGRLSAIPENNNKRSIKNLPLNIHTNYKASRLETFSYTNQFKYMEF